MSSLFHQHEYGRGLFLFGGIVYFHLFYQWQIHRRQWRPKPPTKKEPPLILPDSDEAIQQYISAETARFHRVSADEWHSDTHNSSINATLMFDPACDRYSPEYTEPWTKRILLESTPRGTVAMRYCPHILQFEYACDNTSQLSYELLNACAMKFVRVFKCRSLYDDYLTLPAGVVGKMGALSKAIEEYEKEHSKKNREIPAYHRGRVEVDPKMMVQKKPDVRAQARVPKKEALEHSRNRFRRVGRSLSDIPLIQPVPVVKKVFNYAEYKAQQAQKEKVILPKVPKVQPSTDSVDDLVVSEGDTSSTDDSSTDSSEYQDSLNHSDLLCNEVGYDVRADSIALVEDDSDTEVRRDIFGNRFSESSQPSPFCQEPRFLGVTSFIS